MEKYLPVKQFNEIKKAFQASKQNGFTTAVNARNVHEWLEVKTKFNDWIKKRIEKYGFINGVDYCVLTSPKKENNEKFNNLRNGAPTKDYHLTPDCIKQLAMIESSEKGKLARLYFLDCERIAIAKIESEKDRQSLKVEFRPMTDAILKDHEDPKPYHFSNECDMINRIVLGMSASSFRKHHCIDKNESVRDYMTDQQMKAVIDMQRANTVFITMGMSFSERKAELIKLFDRNHKQILIDEVIRIES